MQHKYIVILIGDAMYKLGRGPPSWPSKEKLRSYLNSLGNVRDTFHAHSV